MPTLSPVVEAKAARSVATLKRYYEIGQSVRKPRKLTPELAATHEIDLGTLRKIRQFADQYDKNDLEELCQLRKPDGLPLHWGYILYLLTLPWKPKAAKRRRSRLQAEAARDGWTAPELYAEIKRRFPEQRRGSVGGRPRKSKRLDWLVEKLNLLLRDLSDCLRDAESETGLNDVDWQVLSRSLAAVQKAIKTRIR